jgi:hypothetical protein
MAGIAMLLSLRAPATATGDEIDVATLPDITNRMYAIDLYQGSVLGSLRLVGMGGAQVAIAEGAAGMASNPAAAAVRAATSNDKWDWDWFVDWLNPDLATDFDNNGILTEETPEALPVLALGALVHYKKWAVGGAATIQSNPIAVGDAGNEVVPQFVVGRFVVARSWMDDEITGGLSVRAGTFEMRQQDPNQTLFDITGSGLEVGVTWRPRWDFRVGGAISFPITGTKVNTGTCDPNDCAGYILPDRVEVPWRISAGVGYRFADSTWNRQVKGYFRDERAVMVAADVVVFGPSPDAFGLEAFVKKKLQRSGASTVVSGRVGVEYEWKPGRLRLRGGSYWEPGRFNGVGGRLHVTLGLDVRIYSFRFWGKPRRARLSFTGDYAERYGNAGLSLGLWH